MFSGKWKLCFKLSIISLNLFSFLSDIITIFKTSVVEDLGLHPYLTLLLMSLTL